MPEQSIEEIFLTNGIGITKYTYGEKKMNFDPYLLPYVIWIIDLNVTVKTVNLLEVIIKQYLEDR